MPLNIRRIAGLELIGFRVSSLVMMGLVTSSAALIVLFAVGFTPVNAMEAYDRQGVGGLSRYANAELFPLPWERPNIEWDFPDVEVVGIDQAQLKRFEDDLRTRNTRALLIIKDNKVVLEWYAPGYGANSRMAIAGVTKGVTAGIALALAVDDGLIGLDDLASDYIPSWQNDPERSPITIRHLVTHSSGIENVEWGRGFEFDGWKGEFADNRDLRFELALTRAPVLFEPGSRYGFSSVGYYPLSYAITKSLQSSPETDLKSLLSSRVMETLGIPNQAWRISYGQSYELDGLKLYTSTGGATYTARAVAKIGQMVLDRGSTASGEVLSSQVVRDLTLYGDSPRIRPSDSDAPGTSIGWFVNIGKFFCSLQEDAFLATGADHQVLLVVPGENLVFVRLGGPLVLPASYPHPAFWQEFEDYMFVPLMDLLNRHGSQAAVAADAQPCRRKLAKASTP